MAVSGTFTANFTDFFQAVDQAEVKLRGFGNAAEVLGGQLSAAIDKFGGRQLLEQATYTATAIEKIGGTAYLTNSELKAAGATMDEAIQKLRAWGQEVPESFQKVSDAAAKMNASLKQTGDASSVTDVAIEALTEKVVELASAAGMLEAIRSSAEFGNQLTKLQRQTGLSVETLQELNFAAKTSGVSFDTMTTAISRMEAGIGEGGKVAESLQAMGLNLEQLKAQGPDAFFSIVRAVEALPDPFARSQAAVELFGRSGREILAVAQNLDAARDAAHDAGVVMSDETVRSLEELSTAIDTVTLRFKVFIAEGVVPLAPWLVRILDLLTKIASYSKIAIEIAVGKSGLQSAYDQLEQMYEWAKFIKGQATFGFGKEQGFGPPPGGIGGFTNPPIGAQTPIFQTSQLPANLPNQGPSSQYSFLSDKFLKDAEKGLKPVRAEVDKFAESLKNVTSYGQDWQQTLLTINGSVVEAIKFYKDHGAAVDDLARVYKLTKAQVESVVSSMKAEAQAEKDAEKELNATIKAMDQFEESSVKAAQAIGKSLVPQLHTTLETMGMIPLDAKAIGESMFQVTNGIGQGFQRVNGVIGLMPNLTDQAKKHMHDLTTITIDWVKLLSDIPGMLAAAFTGGGGIMGAIQGIGTMIGSALGDTIGRTISALGKFGGPIGAAIGSLAGPLIGAIGNLFGGSEESRLVNAPREMFVQAAGGLAQLNQQVYAATGSLKLVQDLLNARTEADYKNAIDAINTALGDLKTKLGDATTAVSGIQEKFKSVYEITPDLQKALNQAYDAKNINDYLDALKQINGVLDDQAAKFDKQNKLIEKYGLDWTQAGEAFKQQKINESAAGLIDDFTTLKDIFPDLNAVMGTGMSQAIQKAGGDASKLADVFSHLSDITGGMGASVEQFYLNAKKAGVEVPENMKPILQTAIDAGQLFDSAGNKITDMSQTGLTFGKTMQDVTSELTDAIKTLTDVIKDRFGGAFDQAGKDAQEFAGKIPRKVTVEVEERHTVTSGAGGGTVNKAATGGVVLPFTVRPFAQGGVVPDVQRYAGGGFTPQGTDTVPAMLTPGEIILNRAQQQALFAQPRPSAESIRLEIPLTLDGREITRVVIPSLDRELRKRRRLGAA